MTVHLHRNTEKKERIWYPGRREILTGAYTNSPQVLVRYDVTSPDDKYLTLVLSQYKKFRDVPYTLSIFATSHFALSPTPPDLEYCIERMSSWSDKTAGGRIGQDSFINNPMFAVQVPSGGGTLEVRLSTSKSSAINALLAPVKNYGQGIDKMTAQPVLDTGKYRHGFSVARKFVKGGSYVLVVSNFHLQQGVFHVKLYSSSKIKMEEIRP